MRLHVSRLQTSPDNQLQQYISMSDSSKKHMIKMVEFALFECDEAPKNPDRGYPYATGFARETLKEVLAYLSKE